jgi:hypothetical protein
MQGSNPSCIQLQRTRSTARQHTTTTAQQRITVTGDATATNMLYLKQYNTLILNLANSACKRTILELQALPRPLSWQVVLKF